ncbi:hypothetical protein BXY64_2684 [Marinifilum flexuosum]|uniref:Uncharacterized protein n=1 Tax=Marinifilum flexuosum TaxID=1117708 RepID=A0A419X4N9_9BACT|nr:hypothetical protein BXY64_2684 [Marinifilum flexuosum]
MKNGLIRFIALFFTATNIGGIEGEKKKTTQT